MLRDWSKGGDTPLMMELSDELLHAATWLEIGANMLENYNLSVPEAPFTIRMMREEVLKLRAIRLGIKIGEKKQP